jgi:hypothetical protein
VDTMVCIYQGWYSDPVTLSTVVIAAATVVNLVISAFLWRATANATSITKQVFEAAHRPYLSVRKIDTQTDLDEHQIVLKIALTNFGSVPANSLEVESHFFLDSEEIDVDIKPIEPSILMPTVPLTMFVALNEMQNVIEGKARLEFKIALSYKGVTKQQYGYEQHTVYQPENHLMTLISAKGS